MRWLSMSVVLAVGLLSSLSVQALVVLQYHQVGENTPAATSVKPEQFLQQLEYLEEENFSIWSLPQLTKALRAKKPLPDKTVVITFDDGYASIYREAFPLLRKRQWPFTIFINPEVHDKKFDDFASWAQLQEMAKFGASIANHSEQHSHLIRKLKGENEPQWLARIEADINNAEKRIKAEVDQSHKTLAYPYGEYNQPLEELLKKMGYIAFGQHSGAISSLDPAQSLARFPLGGQYADLKDFVTKVQSLPLPIKSQRYWDENNNPLPDGSLLHQQQRPQLELVLSDNSIKSLNCFASNQGAAQVEVLQFSDKSPVFRIQAKNSVAVGRSRYNCTATSHTKGRFYWYSMPWVREPAANENWPD